MSEQVSWLGIAVRLVEMGAVSVVACCCGLWRLVWPDCHLGRSVGPRTEIAGGADDCDQPELASKARLSDCRCGKNSCQLSWSTPTRVNVGG